MNVVKALRTRAGLTQADLAESAGTSQPTIAAYERGAKSPTVYTLARLAQAAGMELSISFVRPLTREDRRSIAVHRAIAEQLLADPVHGIARARRNLRLMRTRHPHARHLFDLWRRLLTLPVTDLAELLVDPRPWMRELRQVTPFAGLLDAAQRAAVYRAFAEEESSAA